MDFKKLSRFLIFLIIFLIINIIKTNVLAEETFVRICKYHNKDTNTTLFVKWRGDSYAPSLYDESDNYLGVFVVVGSQEEMFEKGCRANVYYKKGVTGDSTIIMGDKIGTTKNDYRFDGVVSEGDDVLYSGSFLESKENPDENIFLDYTVNCSYTLPNKYKVVLKIGVGGDITVQCKDENGKDKNITLQNPAEIFKSINEKKICPPTICYNKETFGSDKILFYSSSNVSCPRVIGGETNSLIDRQNKEQDKLPIFLPAEEREKADQLKEKVSDTSDIYLTCLKLLDSSDKCKLEKISLETMCRNSDGVNIACNVEKRKYITCIEKNYTQEEIDLKCGVQEKIYNQAQDALIEYGNETRDPTVNFIVTKDYGTPNNFEFELKEITKEEIFGKELIEWLKSAFLLIQVGSIIIVIILTMLDVVKAVASSEEGTTKKIFKNITIRFIIVAIFLLLPILIEFILGLIDIPNTNPLD